MDNLPCEGPAPRAACPDWVAGLNPFVAPYVDDPAVIHARLRRETPVAYNDVLGMWLVSRYDDICEVLKDPLRFSSVGIMSSRRGAGSRGRI